MSNHVHSTSPSMPTPLTHCPLAFTNQVLAGKWKAPLLWWLGHRSGHFGQLKRWLPGLSAKMLAKQLRELERDGLIVRRAYWEGRVRRVRYSLAEPGREFLPILEAMCDWGGRWRPSRPAGSTGGSSP